MINKEFFVALADLEKEKGINKDVFLETLEAALTSAYKRNYGEATPVVVKLNPDRGSIKVYAQKTVVLTPVDEEKEISLEEARLKKKSTKVGDIVQTEVSTKDFGRIAAQTAKQVIVQRLRDLERNNANIQYAEKENELLTCLIHRIEGDNVFVEIASDAEGIMGKTDQIASEKYRVNDKVKVYVKKVKSTVKGPQILVSRSHPGFVKRLFELEVPEIRQNVVTIKGISRDAGSRTKMAVYSEEQQVDALGACVGAKSSRVNAVVKELNGEKIDIVEWCENPAEYIARALRPAKVLLVEVDPEAMAAKVVVPDDKLSLAIGKDGQNVRLAAKLTGWKIDVKPESIGINGTMNKNQIPAQNIEETENFENIEEMFDESEVNLNYDEVLSEIGEPSLDDGLSE